MDLVMKISKNLGAKLLALALLSSLFIVPAAAIETMNDYVTDYGLTPPYAQTSWSSIHRDSRNSDFTPFVAPVEAEIKWEAIDGAAVLAAVTIGPGPEGKNLYVTTGKGDGSSNLYALNPIDGTPRWSSNVLGSWAVASSAIVDSEGHVYISDSDNFYAFYPNGENKWVEPIPANFVTAIFTVGGYVGGVTKNGQVLILNRDDGSEVADIIELPGGVIPTPTPMPPGLWQDLMDSNIIDDLWLFRLKFEVTNTPAVNPINDRIYIPTWGGILYGIDITPEGLKRNFSSRLMGPSGTSPAISPDGSRIYVADGVGILYAFDALAYGNNIPPKWSRPIGQSVASPSISPDGTIYTLGGSKLIAISDNGDNGDIKNEWDFSGEVGTLGAIGPFLPTVQVNSIVSVTPYHLYVTASIGYQLNLIILGKPISIFAPVKTSMFIVDPDNSGPPTVVEELRDTTEGVLTMGSNGDIYITHGAIFSSIAKGMINLAIIHYNSSYPYSLDDLIVVRNLIQEPIGGVSALEPELFIDLVESGIHWVQDLDATALAKLDSGSMDDVDMAYTSTRRGVVQLGATANSISDAEERGEIDSQSAQQARQRVDTAKVLLNNAKNHIAQARLDPNEGLLNSAKQLIENAEFQFEEALSILAGPAAPPLTRVNSKISRLSEGIPVKSELVQNYPNPFNPETWIPYNLAKDADVIIKIYNVSGQLIRTLDLDHQDVGFYLSKDKAAYWDGRDNLGEKVASGIYFYALKAGDFRATRRMLIMK